jgi:hypothetical protein
MHEFESYNNNNNNNNNNNTAKALEVLRSADISCLVYFYVMT